MMQTAAPDVRMAVPEDRSGIIALTTLLHGENGLFSRDDDKVQEMLGRFFVAAPARRTAAIGVIGPVGAPVASIYLGLDQPVYTADWALVEQWNFVHPEHRKTDYAKQLLCYAKLVADGMKLPLLVGILSNKRTEAKVRLYEREMEKAGAFFVYNSQFAPGAWG